MGTATGTYAKGTTVAPEKSRSEIESTLRRYGATAFGYLTDQHRAIVQFRAHDRLVRFAIALPDASDRDFTHDRRGYMLTTRQSVDRAAAEERRRWRCLLLAIKAKLEVVESGIASFEEEFAVHFVLPDGSTVGEWLLPQVAEAYERNEMPVGMTLALPAAGGTSG